MSVARAFSLIIRARPRVYSLLAVLLASLSCRGDVKTDPGFGPAAIEVAQGNLQVSEVGTTLVIPPAVLVTTESGAPAEGVEVLFAVATGSGNATGTAATTGIDGIASVGSWTLGTAAGSNTLTARSPGLSGSPLTFTATAMPGPPVEAELTVPPPGSIGSGSLFSPQPVVLLKDVYGNPDGLAGTPVSIAVLQGAGGSLQGTTTTTTDATGAARFTDLRIQGPVGDYTLGFNSPPLPPVTAVVRLVAGLPTSLAKQAGDNQSAPVGNPVPINPSVSVSDANGNPVSGVAISFSVVSGGGTIATPSATTNALGIASAGTWILGPLEGSNTVSATAAGLAGSPAIFTATGTTAPPGPPASIAKISGDGQSAVAGTTAAESLVVQVRDANGLGVPGVSVTWAAPTGGGSISSPTVISGANGLAAVTWMLGTTIGPNTARARVSSFTTTFSGTGVAGAPIRLAKLAGDNQSALAGSPVAIAPTVFVTDAHDNPVFGVAIGFSIASGGGTIAIPSAITNAQGVASGGTWTLGPVAGSNTVTANAAGLAGSPATFTATGTATSPNPPASIVKISGASQTAVAGATVADSLVVRVRDANGVGVPGVTVTWSVLTGGGSVAPSSVATDGTGLAATAWTLGTTAGSNTVRASIAGFTTSFTATGVPGPAATLAIQAGNNQSAPVDNPVPVSPAVLVSDANSNPVSGVTIGFSVASGGGTIATPSAITNALGIATGGTWTLGPAAGSNILTADAAGLIGSPATFTATGTTTPPGAPAAIVKIAGDGQSAVAGSAVAESLVVQVRDANGVGVPGVTVSWAILAGGGSVSPPSDVTGPTGLVTVAWTLGSVAGSNTVEAGAAGFTTTFSATGTATAPGSPASIARFSGDGQSAAAGAAVAESLVVQVRDVNGVGVPGVTVTWSVLTGGGSGAPLAATTDGTGLAAASWTLGTTAGPNTIRASAAGFNTTFTGTGIPGPATTLAKLSGDNQSVPINTAVPIDPAALVSDANGNPVAGVPVTFTVITGGGAIESSSSTSNALGIATGGAWTLGPVAGTNTLRAGASGLVGSPVLFSATGTAVGSIPIPLIDMGTGTYLGFSGRLYPNGNTLPSAHAATGAARARNIRGRNSSGNPSPGGKFVLLSAGISNTSQEWCSDFGSFCNSWSFTGQAEADGAVNHSKLVILNGAHSGSASDWDSPSDLSYDMIRDNILLPRGLTEKQVEIVWLKAANPDPATSLPSNQSDAVRLVGQYGDILRALKVRYPNLEIVFMSSRSYGGYAVTGQNPEPFAYESGLAVKWIIQAQIDQMANGGTIVDPRAGNLNFNTVAPWVAWGPYLWADGTTPRSDGLVWLRSDMESDGTHPSTAGETKAGGLLFNFFKTDARASCWFLAGTTCP